MDCLVSPSLICQTVLKDDKCCADILVMEMQLWYRIAPLKSPYLSQNEEYYQTATCYFISDPLCNLD